MGKYLKNPNNNGERVCGWNKIMGKGGGGLEKTCLVFVLETKIFTFYVRTFRDVLD